MTESPNPDILQGHEMMVRHEELKDLFADFRILERPMSGPGFKIQMLRNVVKPIAIETRLEPSSDV